MNSSTFVTILVVVAIALAGYAFWSTTSEEVPVVPGVVMDQMPESPRSQTTTGTTSSTNPQDTVGTTTQRTTSTPGITDGQRRLLEAFGVDPNTATLTPQMIACAEARIGADRVNDIQQGDTPSMGEGATLMTCYNAS
jgi:hypothetical protein